MTYTPLKTAIATAALLLAQAGAAETPIGTTVDSRVIIALKANDAGIAEMMPEGWRLLTLPSGPLARTNLLIGLIDRHATLDPEGKPVAAPSGKAAALLAYGVNPEAGGARVFVLRVYETEPVANTYGTGVPAAISRNATLTDPEEGPTTSHELWSVAPEDGGTFTVDLRREVGRYGWSNAYALPYSPTDPDFHRIYRYDDLAELAMSAALDRPLNGSLTVTSDVPSLASVLDGSEQVTGVLVIPVRVRDISLP